MFPILFLVLLISSAVCHSGKPLKSCQEYTIPVTTNTTNLIWGLPKLENNFDATTFSVNLSRWDSNTTFHPISGGARVAASYQISGTFCSPTTEGNGVVLLATHGFGFDRRCDSLLIVGVVANNFLSYWDPSINPGKYSFVDFAIAKGYSVFFYDRLGLGKSSVFVFHLFLSFQAHLAAESLVMSPRSRSKSQSFNNWSLKYDPERSDPFLKVLY